VARLVRHRTACADQPRVAHFGDRVPLAGERIRWSGAGDPATTRRRRRRPDLFCLQILHSAHAATTATHALAAHSDAHRAVEIEIRIAGGVDGEHGAPCTSRI
jgi:hypothetical protein